MNTGNYKIVESMMKDRNKTISEVTYQSLHDMNIVSNMKKSMESGYKFIKLTPEKDKNFYLNVMGDGRLARIYTGFHDDPVIMNREEQPKSKSYDFVFCKLNGKWKICM